MKGDMAVGGWILQNNDLRKIQMSKKRVVCLVDASLLRETKDNLTVFSRERTCSKKHCSQDCNYFAFLEKMV